MVDPARSSAHHLPRLNLEAIRAPAVLGVIHRRHTLSFLTGKAFEPHAEAVAQIKVENPDPGRAEKIWRKKVKKLTGFDLVNLQDWSLRGRWFGIDLLVINTPFNALGVRHGESLFTDDAGWLFPITREYNDVGAIAARLTERLQAKIDFMSRKTAIIPRDLSTAGPDFTTFLLSFTAGEAALQRVTGHIKSVGGGLDEDGEIRTEGYVRKAAARSFGDALGAGLGFVEEVLDPRQSIQSNLDERARTFTAEFDSQRDGLMAEYLAEVARDKKV